MPQPSARRRTQRRIAERRATQRSQLAPADPQAVDIRRQEARERYNANRR